jgi:hypothetical protein
MASRRSCNRLELNSTDSKVRPVTFVPGLARLATRPIFDSIADCSHHNGDSLRGALSRQSGLPPIRDDNVRILPNELRRQGGQRVGFAMSESVQLTSYAWLLVIPYLAVGCIAGTRSLTAADVPRIHRVAVVPMESPPLEIHPAQRASYPDSEAVSCLHQSTIGPGGRIVPVISGLILPGPDSTSC